MQKKSLLVALFCGALCLTGCLKNEESASVAQVRIAKANELNSIADLNKAKAAAEAVYAQAELTVANAEAKLREANAALVLAQAETEKVRAELLKVQVALEEVKVDEERVKLLELEAELEQTLAEVEAAVAMAEAEKQGWINVMEHAVADAERQALADALEILKAEDALQKYVLDQAGTEAENAKLAGDKYFAALRQVQTLQMKAITTKAEKALVEAGAIGIRDAIYFEMDQIDEEIAKKKALLAYLKEYQEMTPEEAEEALIEARVKMTDAYNAYRAALDIREAAKDALDGNHDKGITGLKNMTADFVDGNPGYQGEHQYKREFEYLTYGTRYAWAKEDGERGVRVLDEEGKETDEFIPLWTSNPGYFAKTEVTKQRYPDLSVYSGTEDTTNDFVVLETTTYTPVKVYFDNANKVLDFLAEEAEAEVAALNKDFEEVVVPEQIKELNAKIAKHNEKLDLHKKYVKARKDSIADKEQAFLDEIAANEAKIAAVQTAWNNWQEYMLVNYDGSRADFKKLWNKQEKYNLAVEGLTLAQNAYSTAIDAVSTKADDLEDLIEDEAHAEGAYRKAIAQASSASATSSTAYKKWNGIDPYTTAVKDTWNKNFDMTKDTINVNGEVYNKDAQGVKIEGTKAAPAQVKYIRAKAKVEMAEKTKDAAEMAYWRHPDGSEGSATYKNNYDQAVDALSEANSAFVIAEDEAEDTEGTYDTVKAQYELVIGTAAVKEAEKAWNINFFGDDGLRGHAYAMSATDTSIVATAVELVSGNWQKKGVTPAVVAGTAQKALLDGVKAYRDAVIAKNEKAGALATAISKEATAKGELADAVKVIIAHIKHVEVSEVKDTEKLEDYLDDTDAKALYEEYLAKKEANEQLTKAKKELFAWYTFNPDKIKIEDNPAKNNKWDDADEAQFSWMKSSYMVDYKAKMLNEDGEWVYIAEKFGELEVTAAGDTTFKSKSSLAYKIEKKQAKIAAMPEEIEAYKNETAGDLKEYLEDIEEVRTNLMYFEPLEASYLAWIDKIGEAEAALNEAKKVEFDAKNDADLAQEAYEALKAVANGKMWVYNDMSKEFVEITVNQAIENLEGDTKDLFVISGNLMKLAGDAVSTAADLKVKPGEIATIMQDISKIDFEDLNSIAGLNFTKALLQEALKVGKVTLQVVLEAFDAELAVINEEIALQTKIAETYKAIMNGWLGIVPNDDSETGPLDGEGEGDDEE